MVAVNRSRPLPSRPVNLFDASVQILDNLIGRTIGAHVVSRVAYVPDAGIHQEGFQGQWLPKRVPKPC